MKGTILFSANRGYALLSSRRSLIQYFLKYDWHVVLATADDNESRELVSMGACLEPVTFSRGGLAPGIDLRAYRRFRSICRHHRPTLVHNFHAKPVIFGTLAARWVLGDDVVIVNSITGLGHAFVVGGWITRLASAGYRLALPKSNATVFQNRDDRALFAGNNWVPASKQRLIVGSGIDTQRFSPVDRASHDATAPVVVMLGRLIWQKGVAEFVAVARKIRERWPGARFIWAGELDPEHPDAVAESWLNEQADIEYAGRLGDVSSLLALADVLLFSSYYREGVPRVVMEAAATGLPTVAFDVPGVREAVRNGDTGYLVPDSDVDKLTACVAQLLDDGERRRAMGLAARQLTEEAFDIRAIQQQYLALYRELGIAV